MDTVRDILDANPSGISRPGILAWARLRIDQDFSEERLEHELRALGPAVVERHGFLWPAGSPAAPSDATPVAARSTVGSPAQTSSTTMDIAAVGDGAPRDIGPRDTEPGGAAPGGPAGVVGSVVESVVDGITDGDAFDDALAAVEPDDASAWRGSAVLGTDSRDWVPTGSEALREPTPGAIPGWHLPDAATAGGGRRRSVIGTIAGATLFIAVLAFDLLGSSGSEPAPTAPAPGATTTGVTGPIDDLAVGDCIAIPTADTFAEIVYIACGAPHEAEVFWAGPAPDGPFPDSTGFRAFAKEMCIPAFDSYTGSAFAEQTVLDYGWFMPTSDGWASGDRTVQCYLVLASGGLSSVSWRGSSP